MKRYIIVIPDGSIDTPPNQASKQEAINGPKACKLISEVSENYSQSENRVRWAGPN